MKGKPLRSEVEPLRLKVAPLMSRVALLSRTTTSFLSHAKTQRRKEEGKSGSFVSSSVCCRVAQRTVNNPECVSLRRNTTNFTSYSI
ncbi:hypothetical protein [Nostoc sp. 106C]|uniref:hypothetical protein n=1 Tax=Nostoc sp. 106C TaxID=1932667 RepID=UPI001180FE78|nr:hypothetical protein [Nostoc sp. 106C]